MLTIFSRLSAKQEAEATLQDIEKRQLHAHFAVIEAEGAKEILSRKAAFLRFFLQHKKEMEEK